jgi:hypothetical protein
VPVRKIAKIVESAMRDADRARRSVGDADWNRAQRKDRRGTLRKFETVEQTIKERDAEKRAKASARAKKKKKR